MSSVLTASTDTSDLDDLVRIYCGKCCEDAPLLRWRIRPVSGELPAGHFQCPTPGCCYAFKRVPNTDPWQPGHRPMKLVPIEPVL